jgi:lysophospholipase L1-like esterase
MKRVSKLAVLAVAASVLVALGNCTAPASAEPINILMMGDSITVGGYYITTLRTKLADHGYNSTVLGKCATSGWTIGDLKANMYDFAGGDLLTPGVNDSSTYILLLIGINDVAISSLKETAPARLGDLIVEITTQVPKAHLIVGNLTPCTKDYLVPRVPTFNAAFATIVDNLHNAGVNFTQVDMFTPMNVNPSYYLRDDGVHPNTEYGHPLMANVWYGGIVSVPEPSCATLAGTGIGGLPLGKAWRRWRCARSASRF